MLRSNVKRNSRSANHSKLEQALQEGVFNIRTGTMLHIEDAEDHFIIITRLCGLDPENIHVQINGMHLFVEGLIANPEGSLKLGRFVRYLPQGFPSHEPILAVEYTYNGWLFIKVARSTNNQASGALKS